MSLPSCRLDDGECPPAVRPAMAIPRRTHRATRRAVRLAAGLAVALSLATPPPSSAQTIGGSSNALRRLPAASAEAERLSNSQPPARGAAQHATPYGVMRVVHIQPAEPIRDPAPSRDPGSNGVSGALPPPGSNDQPSPPSFDAASPAPLPKPESIQMPRSFASPQGANGANESNSLGLAEFESIALGNNPTLAEARAHIDALRGAWIQAGLPPNPVSGYSGQQLGSGGLAEQHGVYVAQEFVTGGKLRLSRAVAAREIDAARQRYAQQEQRVLTDVRLGYYETLTAQRRLQIAERLRDIAAASLDTIERLRAGREATQVDVLRARVEAQSAELIVKTARNDYRAAWQRLTPVLGMPDLAPAPVAGDIEQTRDELDLDSSLARILAASPEVAEAVAEMERARWQVARARASVRPNLDVQGIVQKDNGIGGRWDGAVQVSVPLPLVNRHQGDIRQARAEFVAAERALGRTELSIRRRLAETYQRYASARDQVEDYSRAGGILDNARETLELVNRGYRAGEFAYLDVLTAQRTNAQTNLDYTEALGRFWSAVAEIDGLLLRDSLDNSPAASSVAP